jgi:hypothetical protein
MGNYSTYWASLMAYSYRVTGDKSCKKRAVQTMHFVTYLQQENGRILVSADEYPYYWHSCGLGVDHYLHDFLAEFPEFTLQ